MPFTVTNSNDHMVFLHSHCGNSVGVGAKARDVQVANRFAWQIPEGVTVTSEQQHEPVDPCEHVRGKQPVPLMRAPKTVEHARKLAHAGIEAHHTPAARASAARAAKEILDGIKKEQGSAPIPQQEPTRPTIETPTNATADTRHDLDDDEGEHV